MVKNRPQCSGDFWHEGDLVARFSGGFRDHAWWRSGECRLPLPLHAQVPPSYAYKKNNVSVKCICTKDIRLAGTDNSLCIRQASLLVRPALAWDAIGAAELGRGGGR